VGSQLLKRAISWPPESDMSFLSLEDLAPNTVLSRWSKLPFVFYSCQCIASGRQEQ